MRLIDADALLAKGFPTVYHTEFCTPVIDVADIERMPTIDAVPVVHGEWVETEMGFNDYAWVCTVCGEPWVLNAGTPSENNMNYCPNCGAKMDGGKDDADN